MTNQTGRPARRARAAGFLSALLIAVGAGLLLVAALVYAYGLYAQWRWERAQAALSSQFLPAPVVELPPATVEPAPLPTETPSPTTEPTPSQTATPAAETTPVPVAQPQPTATAAPTATATPRPQPTATPPPPLPSDPGRLIIPKLKLNTAIVIVPVINRQWDVSKLIYDVGLLEGTGFPGRPGNAAISGHVSLRGRGDGPFRWLEKLTPGDEITVVQGETRYSYQVRSTRIVLPSDVSVLAPTEEPTLTLITCTNWDFLKADYTHRLIVAATLVRERTTTSPAQ